MTGAAREVRFVGATLTVRVTLRPETDAGVITVEVSNTEDGSASGRCRVSVLGEGRLNVVAHTTTDEDGAATLAVPDGVLSLLVTRADDVVAQTAWLRL